MNLESTKYLAITIETVILSDSEGSLGLVVPIEYMYCQPERSFTSLRFVQDDNFSVFSEC
jgi:hypothetical protein